jgi:glycosyltransferase involved in cell wall biosynthesis
MNTRIVIPQGDILNSYLSLLRSAMERTGFIVELVKSPWHTVPGITWIHWPEAMFQWQEPADAEVARFEEWIAACATRGLVIWTVHNAFPHTRSRSRRYQHVYRRVAERAQVHLHLGTRSIQVIAERYPSARPLISRTCPHGGYWQLLGNLSPEAARDRLGLGDKERILLTFGDVRDARELFLVFCAARAQGWHVLVVGRLRSDRRPFWSLVNRATRLMTSGRWTLVLDNVPDAKVDLYVKAADAMFIPRYEALNSGNVFLGFTFGKPVVGPAIGNIGEVLTLTGNPTFDPGDPRSIRRAVATLSREKAASLGSLNAEWLQKNGQWSDTASIARSAIEEALRRLNGGPDVSPVDRTTAWYDGHA